MLLKKINSALRKIAEGDKEIRVAEDAIDEAKRKVSRNRVRLNELKSEFNSVRVIKVGCLNDVKVVAELILLSQPPYAGKVRYA